VRANISIWIFVVVSRAAQPQTASDPRARFEQTKHKVEHGEFGKAAEELEQLIQIAPNAPLLHNLLGYCRLQQGDRARAIPEFQRAIALKPDFRSAHKNLGGAYVLDGKVSNAADEFAAVLRIDPEDGEVRKTVFDLARAAFQKQDYADTIKLLGLLQPGNSAAYHEMLGYSSFKKGDVVRAVNEIQKAMDLDSHNEDYVLELSEVFVTNNNGAAAVTLLLSAAQVFPNSARLWFALGVAHLVDENRPFAETALRKSLTLDPKLDLALVVLGQGYKETGQWNELLDTANRLIRANGHNPAGYYYRALALLESPSRDEPQIESLLKKSVSLAPEEPGPYYEWAKLLAKKGEKDEALRELERLTKVSPDFGPAYYQLFRLYREKGDLAKSKEAREAHDRIQAQEREQLARKLLLEVRQRNGGS